ncbi:MAG: AAA family ATPase [Solobacterium sp.]|jgi:5-methylcytosine-specific restriction protein B|nr:AAA family ATPase [Solobacterium sp.]
MAENIIFYGPPGTGKTYFIQSIMNDYIDYDISDDILRHAFTIESVDWILITLILLQNHGKMTTRDIQMKINSLSLGITINAAAVLDKHSISSAPIHGITREQPRIFMNLETTEWYVDLIRVQQYRKDFFEKFLSNAGIEKRYDFITFHQSYAYENFVEGIRPEYIRDSNSIDYSPKSGVFKKLCSVAEQHKEKKYAIFIDEINRGNISEIFGELISLIEVDKREDETGALSVILPYSNETFSVPNNINVYGTMNTADRSIDQIDIALRRRFIFVPMVPDSSIIKSELELNGVDATNIDGVDLIHLFDILNSRIEILLDSQHLIGHALFIKCRTSVDIANVIRNSVVPLLEEYFYDDKQKIQLVFNDLDENGELRPTAIYKHNTLVSNDLFTYTGDYLMDDKKHYYVSDSITTDSLKQIYR